LIHALNLRLAAITLAAVATTVGAQSPVEFKFASSAPPTSPWAKQIDRMAVQVAEETQGKVKITPFYGSQLGSENDAISQISRGRIDMGSFTANSVALQVPEVGPSSFRVEANSQNPWSSSSPVGMWAGCL